MAVSIKSEAILAMREGSWRKARVLWNSYMLSGEDLLASDYNAVARVHECCGDWSAYEEFIAAGLQLYPADKCLAYRQRQARAIRLIAQEAWEPAAIILEELNLTPLQSEWPCGVSYWRREVLLRRAIFGVSDKEELLKAIHNSFLYKTTSIAPWRTAGLLLAIDCLDLPCELRAAFIEVLEPVIQVLRCFEKALRNIKDRDLDQALEKLAEFWFENFDFLTGIPAGYCDFFARLFISRGYLNLYIRLRGCLVRKVTSFGSGTPLTMTELLYRVAYANEQGDQRGYEDLCAYGSAQEYAAKIASFLEISTAYYPDLPYESKVEEQDFEFRDYVSGKSVAVVGPLDVGLRSGEEIDSFDIVVRFNHRSDVQLDEAVGGARTDVSYYVRDILARGMTTGLREGMDALSYAVIDKNSWWECSWLEQVRCRKRERPDYTFFLNNPLLVGYPLAVPRAVLDLLRFKPRRIKVFSSDMYTSLRYSESYLKGTSFLSFGGNVFPGFSVHDPISNFLLMRRLCKRPELDVDPVLKKVLDMKIDEYINCLRKAHSRFVVF